MSFPLNPINNDIYLTPLGTRYIYNSARTAWIISSQAVSGFSGYSGYSGKQGSSGYSGLATSGYSGYSGVDGHIGATGPSGYSGVGSSGYSGYSGSTGSDGPSGYSGRGTSGYSGSGVSGYSGLSGYSGYLGYSGYSGYSGSGISGASGYSGSGISGYSGYKGDTGVANFVDRYDYPTFSPVQLLWNETDNALFAGVSGSDHWVQISSSSTQGLPGISGYSGFNGISGYSGSPNRMAYIKLINDNSYLSSGDGKFFFCIPSEMSGLTLINAQAAVSISSSSGSPSYQIHNATTGNDMLSTQITIDVGEFSSYTAFIPPAINPAYNIVHTGDMMRVDKKISGIGEKGDSIIFTFQFV